MPHRFISLSFYGIFYSLTARRLWIPAAILWIMQYVGFAVFVTYRGFPSPVSLALGIAQTPSLINLFVLGLVAGSLSFGGAYTAIPFVQVEAVLKGGWLPQSVFIDCIAIGNVLPAPLVIFTTFVGFQGSLKYGGLGTAFAGAVVITLGMFFPCFLFTIAGHSLLERLIRNKVLFLLLYFIWNASGFLTRSSSSRRSLTDFAVRLLVLLVLLQRRSCRRVFMLRQLPLKKLRSLPPQRASICLL